MEKKNIKIYLSKQGDLLFRHLKDVKMDELIDWFINVKKISIGGGDIVDYLAWKETKVKNGTTS